MLTLLIGCVILGILAGFLSGLLGIGGGMILVPALIFLFSFTGMDPSIVPTLAVATSITTICFTTFSSTLAHRRHGHIKKTTLVSLIPMLILGALLGSYLSNVLPGWLLLKCFGAFVLFNGVRLWQAAASKSPSNSQPLKDRALKMIGALTGVLAGLFGIGGGAVLVPALNRSGMPIKHAIGTAAASSVVMAVVATATHIYVGWGDANMPAWSTGSVYWPAVGAIVLTSMPFAKVGAKVAKKAPAQQLQRMLACLLLVVAVRFLVFGA